MLRTEDVDLDLAEGDLAHFAPLALVELAVALQCGLPTAGLRLAGEEAEVLGFPVAIHEPGKIALVPRDHLGVEDGLDGLACGLIGPTRRSGGAEEEKAR